MTPASPVPVPAHDGHGRAELRVVFLSGPGGAGKTTAGRMAHRLLSGDWLYFEVDRCQPTVSSAPTFSDDRLTTATLRAVRAYVGEGFRVLVEMDVVGRRRPIVDAVFDGVPCTFIVMTAERQETLDRVLARGTPPGLLSTYEALYDRPGWDDVPGGTAIDSTSLSAEIVAAEIARLASG